MLPAGSDVDFVCSTFPFPVCCGDIDNVLLTRYREEMQHCPFDMKRLFDPKLDDARRQCLLQWSASVQTTRSIAYGIVCDVTHIRVKSLTPNENALRVLAILGPWIELGAGSGYWASLLQSRGAIVIPFDVCGTADYDFTCLKCVDDTQSPSLAQTPERALMESTSLVAATDSTIPEANDSELPDYSYSHFFTTVYRGNHTVLHKFSRGTFQEITPTANFAASQPDSTNLNPSNGDFALFLCWPPPGPSTLASDCLKAFNGDLVALVGELWPDTYHGDFGLTGDAEFHILLANDFHKVADIQLPNWPGSQDRLSLWRRSRHWSIASLECRIAYVPVEDQLPMYSPNEYNARIAPWIQGKMQHLHTVK